MYFLRSGSPYFASIQLPAVLSFWHMYCVRVLSNFLIRLFQDVIYLMPVHEVAHVLFLDYRWNTQLTVLRPCPPSSVLADRHSSFSCSTALRGHLLSPAALFPLKPLK